MVIQVNWNNYRKSYTSLKNVLSGRQSPTQKDKFTNKQSHN